MRRQRADGLADLLPVQDTVVGEYGAGDTAAKPGHHGKLEVENVRAGFADYFLAMLCMQLHADGVGHRAGGDEQGSLFAENLSSAALQAIDGGIFPVHVIANFGFAKDRELVIEGIIPTDEFEIEPE